MACSSSPSISTPVSAPKIDRIYLTLCDKPNIAHDDDPVLWLKGFVDQYRGCADKQKMLSDYIKVIEGRDLE